MVDFKVILIGFVLSQAQQVQVASAQAATTEAGAARTAKGLQGSSKPPRVEDEVSIHTEEALCGGHNTNKVPR